MFFQGKRKKINQQENKSSNPLQSDAHEEINQQESKSSNPLQSEAKVIKKALSYLDQFNIRACTEVNSLWRKTAIELNTETVGQHIDKIKHGPG